MEIVAFFPMHYLGLVGMPRRVYTYLEGLGWQPLNGLATGGAFVLAIGIAVFLANVFVALRRPANAPDNPWDADTLEWSTSSPPPNYNFAEIPVVHGRWALWDDEGRRGRVVGVRSDRREVLVTDALDGAEQTKVVLPAPSAWPLLLAVAVAVTFLGVIFTVWAVPVGMVLAFLAVTGWHWPRTEERTPPWAKERAP